MQITFPVTFSYLHYLNPASSKFSPQFFCSFKFNRNHKRSEVIPILCTLVGLLHSKLRPFPSEKNWPPQICQRPVLYHIWAKPSVLSFKHDSSKESFSNGCPLPHDLKMCTVWGTHPCLPVRSNAQTVSVSPTQAPAGPSPRSW